MTIKRCMSHYTVLAEHKKEQTTKEKIQAFSNCPGSVDRFMKTTRTPSTRQCVTPISGLLRSCSPYTMTVSHVEPFK